MISFEHMFKIIYFIKLIKLIHSSYMYVFLGFNFENYNQTKSTQAGHRLNKI